MILESRYFCFDRYSYLFKYSVRLRILLTEIFSVFMDGPFFPQVSMTEHQNERIYKGNSFEIARNEFYFS